MVIFDTSLNNRDKWINEIKKYTNITSDIDIIQLSLSFTLQACRNGDLNKYHWNNDCK